MPPKTVDYKITPKGVLSLEGQGGTMDIGGVVVPVRLRGPWHDVQNELVWSEMRVIGPNGELNPASMANLPEGIKDKLPGDVLDKLPGILGGGGATGEGTGSGTGAEEVIEGILGGGSGGEEGTEGESGGGIQLPGGLKLPGQD
jgi:AsmA protein